MSRVHTPQCRRGGRGRRGFSLVEVLLAVFILGIGVISIAAIFPAGISLQRQSNDDTLGPVVASNALGLIRSRLTQEDFGAFSDFNPNVAPFALETPLSNNQPVLTIQGDWPWMRPGVIFDDTSTPSVDEGAIDVFSHESTRKGLGIPGATALQTATELPNGWPSSQPQKLLYGIPYNPARYYVARPTDLVFSQDSWQRAIPEPRVIITQRERYWPMLANAVTATTERPQYVWDCMFRRFQGRVQVAVFVYRVNTEGSAKLYSLAPANPLNSAAGTPLDPARPPIPLFYLPPVAGPNIWKAQTPPVDPSIVPGTAAGSALDLTKPAFQWQLPGQWLLDQNAVIHRVLAGRRNTTDGPVRFARPVPVQALSAVMGYRSSTPAADADTLSRAVWQAWFVPARDNNGVGLTPVYILVEDL
jgi:prepilin-type N-terminal cleavage/methylation domain-containing protein